MDSTLTSEELERLYRENRYVVLLKQSLSHLAPLDLPIADIKSGLAKGAYRLITEPMSGRRCVVIAEVPESQKRMPRPGRSMFDGLADHQRWERITSLALNLIMLATLVTVLAISHTF